MPSRKFRAEGPILYGRYDCGHGEWLELSGDSDPGGAYAEGYLPYSGEAGTGRHLFYMGRSLRVDLRKGSMDKKRRYSHRQWLQHGLVREHLPRETFLTNHGSRVMELAREWMSTRFGQPYMDESRLRTVLHHPFMQDILTWTRDGQLVAFAMIIMGNWGAHYWFSFYSNASQGNWPAGHGYMGDFMDWARGENLSHAYLGTAYGEKSRYKSRGINGIEFWDGTGWNTDRMELSCLRRQDDAPGGSDCLVESGAAQFTDNRLV